MINASRVVLVYTSCSAQKFRLTLMSCSSVTICLAWRTRFTFRSAITLQKSSCTAEWSNRVEMCWHFTNTSHLKQDEKSRINYSSDAGVTETTCVRPQLDARWAPAAKNKWVIWRRSATSAWCVAWRLLCSLMHLTHGEQSLVSATGRFIFRHLCSCVHFAEQEKPLFSCCKQSLPLLWFQYILWGKIYTFTSCVLQKLVPEWALRQGVWWSVVDK